MIIKYSPYPIAVVNRSGEMIAALQDNHQEHHFYEWQRREGGTEGKTFWLIRGDHAIAMVRQAFAEAATSFQKCSGPHTVETVMKPVDALTAALELATERDVALLMVKLATKSRQS